MEATVGVRPHDHLSQAIVCVGPHDLLVRAIASVGLFSYAKFVEATALLLMEPSQKVNLFIVLIIGYMDTCNRKLRSAIS